MKHVQSLVMYYDLVTLIIITVEPPIKDTLIKDTIEITSEQRTRFNVPNGDFPIKDNLSTKDKMTRKQWVPNVSVIRRFNCIEN